jgi:hypothetical protein
VLAEIYVSAMKDTDHVVKNDDVLVFHIARNDDDVLVATKVDVIRRDLVVADTLIINKATGDFDLQGAAPNTASRFGFNDFARGKCVKN